MTSAVKLTFTTLPLGAALAFFEGVVVFVEAVSVPLDALKGVSVVLAGESGASGHNGMVVSMYLYYEMYIHRTLDMPIYLQSVRHQPPQ